MAKPDPTRRNFLIALTLALGALFPLGRFLTPRVKRHKVLLRASRGELPGDGALVYRQQRVALISAGGAVTALSLVCPHLGCTVSVTPTGLVCPCHGSRFDREGAVLEGPADRALTRLRVLERGESIEVLL